MELTVQNVYGLLIRSKLLTAEEVKGLYERWNKEAGDGAKNVVKFCKWMITNRYLTEYQATMLARGYADGFFLNRYKILGQLGKGRMAGVYRAQHETGPIVAIKVLPPSRAKDRALLSRFRREAKLATRMKHPNVVRTFEVGHAKDAGSGATLHYLVMEHLEGETLQDLLNRKKRLDPEDAVRLIHQALLGLQHLHEQGLVHRDLKPSNAMLARPRGAAPSDDLRSVTLKILDLGLGRALVEQFDSNRPTTEHSALTTEGALLGTPDYMAPEQARDARSADVRADIYSLGCVLYHLMAGEPPFPDSNVISQMIRHATETPRPLTEINPKVPEGLQQILFNWMMAKDPAQRYPTPERAAQALQVFLVAGSDSQASMPEADPKMRKFLTYLADKKKDDATEKPKSTADTDKHEALVEPAPPVKPPKRRTKAEKAKLRAKKKRRLEKQAQAAKPSAKDAIADADVELVPLTGPMSIGSSANVFSLRFTRRDLVMFCAGVIMVLLGTGIGMLAAWAFGAF